MMYPEDHCPLCHGKKPSSCAFCGVKPQDDVTMLIIASLLALGVVMTVTALLKVAISWWTVA